MPSFIIREISCDTVPDSAVLDGRQGLSLAEIAQACQQSHDWIVALVEHSILEVQADLAGQPEAWLFLGEDVARARRAWRLQRDFDASLSAVAVMLDLLDEVKQLRAQLRFYQG